MTDQDTIRPGDPGYGEFASVLRRQEREERERQEMIRELREAQTMGDVIRILGLDPDSSAADYPELCFLAWKS